MIKHDDYMGCYYIATHVDDVIISANIPSKYMYNIDINVKFREITD